MKVAVAVSLLALLSSATVRAQGAMNSVATASSLFPLFITCDLKDEFLTPDVDSRIAVWFETPVSIEGARARREAAEASSGKIVPVPLVLDVHVDARCESAQMRPVARGR